MLSFQKKVEKRIETCYNVFAIRKTEEVQEDMPGKKENLLQVNTRLAHIAQALARDYADLCYVNMATGEFIEYRSSSDSGLLTEARRWTGRHLSGR